MGQRIKLVKSRVEFNEELHTYNLDGKQLSGVTPIIAWLFPDTYKNIPARVLERAAAHGTAVHKACEMYDETGLVDDENETLVNEYRDIMDAAGMYVCRSEYLVSDNENVASCIDKVCTNVKGKVCLADIKTTSKVHSLLVQVQLSIYAYLYELQNAGNKVDELFVIWLPKPQYGNPSIIYLNRIPSWWCEKVIESYIAGMTPAESVAALAAMGIVQEKTEKVSNELPADMEAVTEELSVIKRKLDEYGEREKELKAILMEAMQATGDDKWYSDCIQITRKAASERETFDSKKFKAENPDMYQKFVKTSKVAESLVIKYL